jgi:hypothetical protein
MVDEGSQSGAPAAARRPFRHRCLLASVLLAATACATATPAPVAPVAAEGTVARARQNYRANIGSCQQIRESQLATLGPPMFVLLSGDQPFNECLARALTHLDVELSEAD